MITIWHKDYESEGGTPGEIRIGWASWDEGHTTKSIKWAYRDSTGKISRGAPEVPFDVLVEMALFAIEKGELDKDQIKRLKKYIQSE